MSSRLCVAQTHSITWEGLPPVRAGGVQQAGTHSTPCDLGPRLGVEAGL